ncbi:hypothetical protein LTR62_002681 [Meristemomyces frigidus]|uniref:Alpha/beta hydrolase fold-3 domain-containing protein n=1 Tax=Meristemomyces frigidus TaxID=1508187 RepID=A0AAN7TSI5_9PEZI|nr:hypothetical protein LTR62_002681 [Meristemomyces frigidus]
MAPAPQASLSDKLGLLPKTGNVLLAVSTTMLTRPFISSSKPLDLFRDVAFTAMRSFLSNVNTPLEQWMTNTTEAEYLAAAKKLKYTPDTEVLTSGLKVHRLGAEDAEHTILFFHGGGYNLGAGAGHLIWLHDLVEDLSKQKSVNVVLPSYTLAPQGQYPLQLQQATEVLQWLVSTKGKSPSKIIIAGDSAGGNLALALISHILHPHPSVPKLELKEPLAAALLISPWVTFVPDDECVRRNQRSDLVTPVAAKRWSSNFMGSTPTDNYTQPLDADSTWFSGLDNIAKDVLIYGGGGEILIDSIKSFAHKLQQAHPRVEVVVQPRVGHDDVILDKVFGYEGRTEGTRVMEDWVEKRMV